MVDVRVALIQTHIKVCICVRNSVVNVITCRMPWLLHRALFNTYTGNINNGYDNDLTYDDNYWLSE